jgi:hypothetical protein
MCVPCADKGPVHEQCASSHLLGGAYKCCVYPLRTTLDNRRSRGGYRELILLFFSSAFHRLNQSSELGNHPQGTTHL